MRNAVFILAVAFAAPVAAQIIDGSGVRANGVRIDAGGIHAGDTSVSGRGVGSGVRGGRTINGNDATLDVNCRGGGLTVNGNRNTITAIGCARITLAGNHNRLRWHRDDGRTAIANVGNGNRVSRF